MNQKTQNQLTEINREFYQQTAEEFSSKRQYVWEGWKILGEKHLKDMDELRVLDIGCGNGRFGKFLFENFEDVKYTGVDFSQELLEEAEKSLGNHRANLIKSDIDSMAQLKNDEEYNLVVMFGVMHHVPGFENRVELLKQASQLLNKSVISSEAERSLELRSKGRDFSTSSQNLSSRNDNSDAKFQNQDRLLVVSFWQFAEFERFKKKIVSWDKLPEVDQGELEEGDYLLDFDDSLPYRYCHSFTDEEIEKMKNRFEIIKIDDYAADGKEKYNRYLVSERLISYSSDAW